jgi:hypothetical protein
MLGEASLHFERHAAVGQAVLAHDGCDADNYVRNYDEFVRELGRVGSQG